MWNQHHLLVRTYWLILLFLVGCNPIIPIPSPTAALTFPSATTHPETVTPSPIPRPTTSPTFTPLPPAPTTTPTIFLYPSYTPTDTPTITPTFTPYSRDTATPAPAAQCPVIATGTAPTPVYFSLVEYPEQLAYTEADVLNYLNTFGPVPLVREYKRQLAHNYRPSFYYQDVTNDGIPEIIMVLLEVEGKNNHKWLLSTLYIFGCQGGAYQILFKQTEHSDFVWDVYDYAYYVTMIKDGNRNGIPEITFLTGIDNAGGHTYQMYEWNGSNFDKLLVSGETEYPGWESGNEELFVFMTGHVYYQDIDGDQLDEFVIVTGIPAGAWYISALPFRNVTCYHKWDGLQYQFLKEEIDPPEYRFQAVQDGDRFSLSQDFHRALDSYQQAIFSDKLEWWSEKRREFLRVTVYQSLATPIPPIPDPNEYPNLAAYSRYRIMLIHLLNGHLAEAQVVYDTLQKLYPEGRPGNAYAKLAESFWNEYQKSKDMRRACNAAIIHTKANERELLKYLGNWQYGNTWFGEPSLGYTPESICPF